MLVLCPVGKITSGRLSQSKKINSMIDCDLCSKSQLGTTNSPTDGLKSVDKVIASQTMQVTADTSSLNATTNYYKECGMSFHPSRYRSGFSCQSH
ncbi:hypothetical protein AVEN_188427-1 [Araneus ventricosus]|uniref:Uncharacterized protein n=1 Tax=Araneus ventricosus TaxID=182803 RepID=A0A4Y2VR58_ARAVE|nr:hypothetical protein AVEN_31294-1 [Araneus ventricosus]GBO26888.1 hypothetical protein AVEN_188427-1 [Araneus ventricosus]